jgi:hypothetical protein
MTGAEKTEAFSNSIRWAAGKRSENWTPVKR